MHSFFWVGAILHATAMAVVGFFVLFAAGKSGGLLRTIGNVLGIWLFILAVLALVGGAAAPMFGGGSYGFPMMDRNHYGWMHQWPSDQPAPTQQNPPAQK